MRIGPLFALLTLASLGQIAAAEPPGEALVYKQTDGQDLHLYVTKPSDWSAGDQRPAIVFFHGGGWVGGAPGQFSEHAQYFTSRGLVCVQVQYRLLDRAAKEPPVSCTQDAKSAMRWVRSHAGVLGIDPQRIASAGGSAGGHLAAFVGTVDGGDAPDDPTEDSPKSQAMLLFNPVFDNGPGGWGAERVGERYPEFSPLHNLSADDPPSIVFLGTEDKLIPVETGQRWRDRCEELGVRCELHLYEGAGHGFFNFGRDEGRWYHATVTAADRFLEELGWVDGPPTLEPTSTSKLPTASDEDNQ